MRNVEESGGQKITILKLMVDLDSSVRKIVRKIHL